MNLSNLLLIEAPGISLKCKTQNHPHFWLVLINTLEAYSHLNWSSSREGLCVDK